MQFKTIKWFALFWLIPLLVLPCTTAIVSGRATADGRPLLWKHRDSGHEQNVIRLFTDGRFRYFGLVNASDSTGKEVWAGVNESGFAIMNSASYNLKTAEDTSAIKDREGELMKMALRLCATLEDFERLLDSLPKPLGVEANFGVIDAQGGAAYYETGNFAYQKFDANDSLVAPEGYLIRTNFSFSGKPDAGYGYIRYQMAEQLFKQAANGNQLDAQYILSRVSRCLKHALTGVDLTASDQSFVSFRDFIPRKSSVSVVLVRGVKSGNDPAQSLMWTILGFPLTGVSLPLWVENMDDIPSLLKPGADRNAPLCEASLALKEKCLPIRRGNGPYYLNLPVLWNKEGSGILQKILPFERSIFKRTTKFEAVLQDSKNRKEDIEKFYNRIEKAVKQFYGQKFDVKLEEGQ
ncbi:Ntn hydrolase family protein [Calditrichota bacterium LG25]